MQGNRLEESNWIPQHLFYCDSYIVIYDVLYNLLWIMGVGMMLIIFIRYFKYHKRPWDVKRSISMYIEIKEFYKIIGFYKRKYL